MSGVDYPISSTAVSRMDRAAACYLITAAFVALVFSIIAWISLWVTLGDDTANPNAIVFFVVAGILCPVCSFTGYRGWRNTNQVTLIFFSFFSGMLLVAVVAAAIADWASPTCENTVWGIFPCTSAVGRVSIYVIIIVAIVIAVWASRRVHRLKKANKYTEIATGEKTEDPTPMHDGPVEIPDLSFDGGHEA